MNRKLLFEVLLFCLSYAGTDALFTSFGATRNLKDPQEAESLERKLDGEDDCAVSKVIKALNYSAVVIMDTLTCKPADEQRIGEILQTTFVASGKALPDIVMQITGITGLTGNIETVDVEKEETDSQSLSWSSYSGGWSCTWCSRSNDWFGSDKAVVTDNEDEALYIAQALQPELANQKAVIDRLEEAIKQSTVAHNQEIKDLKIKYGWDGLVKKYNELKVAVGEMSLLEAFEQRRDGTENDMEKWWEQYSTMVELYSSQLSDIKLRHDGETEGLRLAIEELKNEHLKQVKSAEQKARNEFQAAQLLLAPGADGVATDEDDNTTLTDEDYKAITAEFALAVKKDIERNLWKEFQESPCFETQPDVTVELQLLS